MNRIMTVSREVTFKVPDTLWREFSDVIKSQGKRNPAQVLLALIRETVGAAKAKNENILGGD